MPSEEAKYSKDEKVLCKHGMCYYPAKVLDVEKMTAAEIDDRKSNAGNDNADVIAAAAASTGDGYKYFVHYQGWNPKWDEWVTDARLDKFTDEKAKLALEEQKRILEQRKKKKSGGAIQGNCSKMSSKESDRASITSSVPDHVTLKDIELGSRGSSPSVESTVSSSATVATSGGATGSATTAKKSRAKTSKPTVVVETGQSSGAPEAKKRKTKAAEIQNDQSKSTQHNAPLSANQIASSSCVQSEQDYLTRPEVCVKIPDDLRPLLIDDWDLVVQQMKLARLPAKPTVAQIFKEYVREKQSLRNISTSKLSQIVSSAEGLCAYFDVMLPVQLLYKFERPQYADLYAKDPDFIPSENYGYVHLLRLFVRFGHMLTCTALDDKSISTVLLGVSEFLKYMKKIKPQHLATDYETPTPDYIRLAYS
uniref:Chromo domain-containing protein n=1 Tax=Romanomermis culicivorax TaxID=13658 RepID=A0A915I2X4_ROMCU